MILYETTDYCLAEGDLNIDTLGRTCSTKRYVTWYGEIEGDLIVIMTVCRYPESMYYNKAPKYPSYPSCKTSRKEAEKIKYCFSVSLGDNELEARFTSNIVIPLKITADKDEEILQSEELIKQILKKLGWNLPVGYTDYIL